MMKHKLLLLIFVISINCVIGANPSISFINTRNGLPQNTVQSIVQDENNFLWFATNDGLCKYNGSEFKTFRKGERGLQSSLILSLCLDAQNNRIFIGTADKGVYMYSMRTQRFSPVDIPNCVDIKYIEYDKYGYLWVCDTAYSLFRLKQQHNGVFQVKQFDQKVQEITSTEQGEIIAKYDRWLHLFNNGDEEFNPSTTELAQSNYILNVRLQGDDLYAISDNLIYAIDLNLNTMSNICEIKARNFLITKSGAIVVSNSDGIFIKYPNAQGKSDQTQLIKRGNIWVNSIYEDEFGIVWIGTSLGGVIKVNTNDRAFATEPFKSNIESLYEDPLGDIWVALMNGDIMLMRPNSEMVNISKEFDFLNNTIVSSIVYNDVSNRIYISSNKGVVSTALNNDGKFDFEVELDAEQYRSTRDIKQIVTDSRYIWIATFYDGLMLYDVITKRIVREFTVDSTKGVLRSNTTRSILKDSKGNIWVGTEKGLAIIPAEYRFQSYPPFKIVTESVAISNIYTLPIIESSDGKIWIGTIGDGVRSFRYKGGHIIDIESYDTKSGLSNNNIHALLEDKNGAIWASTNMGLNKIDPKSHEIATFDVNDGLQDNEFCDLAALKRSNNELLFGGVMGLNRFFVDNIKLDTTPPTVSIVDLMLYNDNLEVGEAVNGKIILNEAIEYTDRLDLAYNQNNFSIKFTSMNYSHVGRYKYLYKLEGFDREWIDATDLNNIARYTNIPAGDYTFMVKCHNSSSLSSATKSLHIIITPSIWNRWYAYTAYAMIALMLLVIWVIYYRRLTKHRAAIVIAQREKEQIKSFTQRRIELFTNVSHELRTPLTLIISPLQLIQRRFKLEPEALKLIYKAEQNSKTLLNLVNRIMDFSKSDNREVDLHLQMGDLVSYSRHFVELFRVWAEEKHVAIEFYSSSPRIETLFDATHFESIIYNLLSNAIKHTPKNGSVIVELDHSNDKVTLSVSDTGRGIDKEIAPKIFDRFFNQDNENFSTGVGLALTKSLVELHAGTIEFTSRVNEGTTFTITIPYQNATNEPAEQECEDKPSIHSPELIMPREFVQCHEDEGDNDHKQTILIVEDNYDIVESVTELLTPDYRVIASYDGVSGYQRCISTMPDIVISDIMMPKMDGVELCRLIKNTPLTSHIPVIMLTAKSDVMTHSQSLRANASAFCMKPFDNDVLLSTIASVLANRAILIAKFNNKEQQNPVEVVDNEYDQKFINDVSEIIIENMSLESFNVNFICEKIGVTQFVLNKKIRAITGHTAIIFIKKVKLQRAYEMLSTRRYTVSEVTYAVGFNNLKYFRRIFEEEYGALPSELIRN